MGLFGGIVGGALGAAGSIFGGISASKAMKKVKKNLQEQQRKNQDWYDRRYNEDATQRADAQRILAKTEEMIRDRNRSAAGRQAVTGGTEESVASVKEANNQAQAEAASRIAAQGDARKDAIEQQYQQRDDAYQQQLNNLEMMKAQGIAQAVQGVAQAVGGMAGAF
ncbi:MAG: hypothetical protein NC548_61145 [Lachnospiraceae bacterium]|nr:hypothetical protein [Lachnospiraceae bacterium]